MATVAVERDVELEDTERVDDRSAAARRVPGEHDRRWPERLLLRLMRWDWQHPHSLYLRTQHKVAMVLFRLGLGRFDDDMLVTTIGRKSGLPRRVVVSAIAMDDRLYVVNPFGERAHWYRNLMTDPIITVQQRARTWTARATRVTDRDEAITLYEQTHGASGSAIRWLLRAGGISETAEAFAENIDQFCFVRFDEVDESGPPPMVPDLLWVWPVAGALGLASWLRRRRIVAVASAVLAVPALVGAAAAWNAAYARIEEHGTHPEGRWARLFGWLGPRLTWRLYDAFEDALDVRPDDDVLDVACGCGAFLRTRCTAARTIAGVDHSVTLIDMARQENQERIEAGTAEFVVGDVTELPWSDGTFSVVTSNDVGCYEEKAQVAIEEMYRVLRTGGRAVLADDRHELMEAAGFKEVTVESFRRLGFMTKGVKQ